jgi:hypothetical protein
MASETTPVPEFPDTPRSVMSSWTSGRQGKLELPPERRYDRAHCTRLVRDWQTPQIFAVMLAALGTMTSAQEGFEESWRFVDPQLHSRYLSAVRLD